MSLSREELVRNMMALDDGLREVGRRFGKHVFLADADPVTFGAGHYVFTPMAGSSPRLAITEQYTGTDWSDDERVPTSWTWESQACLADPRGRYPWVTFAEGEIASAGYERLIVIAEGWARAISELAEREATLIVEVTERPEPGRPGAGRTFMA